MTAHTIEPTYIFGGKYIGPRPELEPTTFESDIGVSRH